MFERIYNAGRNADVPLPNIDVDFPKDKDLMNISEAINELNLSLKEVDKRKSILDDLVRKVTLEYVEIIGDPPPTYLLDWTLFFQDDELYVNIKYESTWNYGGHESGYYAYPAKYLYDEDALCDYYTEVCRDRLLIYKKHQEEQRIQNEKQLDYLKNKLGR